VTGEVQLSAVPGGEVEVALPESPTTGYRWSLPDPPAGVAVVDAGWQPHGGPAEVGGGGIRRFRLRASAAGEHRLRFVLRREWEASALREHEVRLTVAD
jgi:inhibitor of cysteine peptidase